MKKLSVFACLSFFALSSFTTKSGEQSTSTKTEIAPTEAIAGSITILSVDPDGYSGVAMTSSGITVTFINPLHLPISVGVVANATITIDCPIIDPPKDPRKKAQSLITGNNEPSTTTSGSGASTTNTYGVAVILSL